ncbi:MAG: preprotein translocase subunit SecG [Candidatus Marinimicrobia bacterium]|nr:preprotein translocase subunit SecG [Candidatus Neomarinimicrobiota bacterium]MBL7046242.1 preprotein translocase subunit SecG [Candidatus Neomarinimicrobiota bacterium]
MYGFLVFLHVLVSVMLILVILMQASKGGGLSGTFGSGMSMAVFGGRGAGGFLTKLTVGLAIGFMVLAILISLVHTPNIESGSIVRKMAEEELISPADELPVPISLPTE